MIDIRQARPDDFESIARLIISDEELFLVYPSGKFPFDALQVKELYEARKDFSVVTYHDSIIGFANLYDFLAGKYVFIGNVLISSTYRGKGYGKKLLQYMINLAHGYDLEEVRLSVFADNAPALVLYTVFGFELYDIREQKNHLGEAVTLLHMRKILSSR